MSTTAVRHSALLDLKLRAHFHALSFVSFAQIGFADGSTRIYPWVDRTAYKGTSACQVLILYFYTRM
jgi:hypothetical protein